MKNDWTWLFVGSLALGAASAAGVACSSSDTVADQGTSTDAGSSRDGSSASDAAGTGDDGGGTGDDAASGSDCGKAPTLHAPKPDGGIFCPFSSADGGKDIYCPESDECCEAAKGSVSTCAAKGSACPAGAIAWECADPADCPASQVCCAHSGDAGAVTVQTDTCGPYLSKFSGTRCADSCGAGELVVCEKSGECADAGGTCTAVRPKANDIGVCH